MEKKIKKIALVNKMMKSKLLIFEQNACDTEKDIRGNASSALSISYRHIGISDFMIEGRTDSFKKYLAKGVKIKLNMLTRFMSGEPISKSYVSTNYRELFDALSAGNFKLVKNFAIQSCGRPEVEKEFDHPFDIALGYALKAIVLDTEDVVERLQVFRDQLSKKGNKSFKGFVEAFESIYHRDSEAFDHSLNEIVSWYPQLRKGVFDHLLDAYLCVWGLGLINLAKHKGMSVNFDHELMPKELQLA